jgi:hypothetical protein
MRVTEYLITKGLPGSPGPTQWGPGGDGSAAAGFQVLLFGVSLFPGSG